MPTCSWCAHPNKRVIKKSGLCSRCNKLALKRAKLERPGDADRDYEKKVCDAQIQLAKDEATLFEAATLGGDRGMELEVTLGQVSKLILSKDLFERQATVLKQQLDASASVQVIDLLNRILREQYRRTLRARAETKVLWDA